MEQRLDTQSSYSRVKNHLDDIVEQVRAKDIPLEKALDLYEEAIRLGNSAADLIDIADFSLDEIEAFNGTVEEAQEAANREEDTAAQEAEQAEQPDQTDESDSVLDQSSPTPTDSF